MDEYPRLVEGVSVTPFDTSSVESMYLVHLPNGKRFQISQDLYCVLRLLDGKNSIGELAHRLSTQLGREFTEREVTWIINEKLAPSGIIAGPNGQPSQPSSSGAAKGMLALRLKIPLLSEKQLRPLTGVGQILFTKPALILLLVLGFAIHAPVYLQLQAIAPSFNLQALWGYGSLTILLLTGLSAVFHELGHLSACHRYGVQYGKLGVGIYIISPVAYVDVTDSWRLPRWQRVVVDIGGIYFQLIFNVVLYGLYLYLGEPVLLFSIVAIDAMLIPNLNPMFKFDGYWALSDAIGVPNLHKRVGDLWKQWLPFRGRSKKQPGAFLQMRTYATFVMSVYALAVTAYFVYFTWMLVWLAPTIVMSYPGLLINTISQTWQSLMMGRPLDALSSILQILFPTILLVGIFFLIKRLVLALYKVGEGSVALARMWRQGVQSAE